MAQYDAIINVGGQFDERAFESRLQQSLSKIEKGVKFTPFSGASRNVRDFSSELDRANQRVITLGASFAVLSTSIRVFKDIISSTIAVEKALTDINSVFGLSIKNMEQFSRGLFNVARETSQSFEIAAEAAKEFSRQGLGAEETLKRTRDALILTRLASLSAQEAVSTLTASINGFQTAALDSTQIVNKLATVDAQFAVSSKDLAQGLARAGAAASDAGMSFDQLIGLITSAQQTTARGGAVIGNALKTIFTRVENKETIDAFESLGVAVTDTAGRMVPAIQLLKNFAETYDKLGGTVKKQAAQLVGGVYQINILKALLSDLEKGSNSIAEKAANTSASAADEAIKRNEALNKSLAALVQQSQTTYQQIGSKVGDLGIGGAAKNLLGGFNTNPVVQALANAGDADTNSFGEKAAAGFIKGFGNAVVFGLGPSIIMALGSITRSVFLKVQRDFADIVGANNVSKQQAGIQQQIVSLYDAGDAALKRQLLTMGSLAERAALVESILSKGATRQAVVASELSTLAGAVVGIRRTPRAASGYDPFSAEASAIRAGVGGAGPGAKPVMIKNFAYGGGVSGPIVANTSEWMVKTGAGSAIYNPSMIQKMGLPPGATPIAAGGYVPNMAGGGTPQPGNWESDEVREARQIYARKAEYLKNAKDHRDAFLKKAQSLSPEAVSEGIKSHRESLRFTEAEYSEAARKLETAINRAKESFAAAVKTISPNIPSSKSEVFKPSPPATVKGAMASILPGSSSEKIPPAITLGSAVAPLSLPSMSPTVIRGNIPNMGFGSMLGASDFQYPYGFPGATGSGIGPGPYRGAVTPGGAFPSAGGQGFGQFLKYAAAPVSSGYDEALKAKQAASLAAEQMAADFAKSQKELDKQRILEVKMTELKQKQIETMAKRANSDVKSAGYSAADAKLQERINEKLRQAESIALDEARQVLQRKWQAKNAKFASGGASFESMSSFLYERQKSAGFGDDYNDYLNRRAGLGGKPPTTPGSSTFENYGAYGPNRPRSFFGRMSDRFAANPLAGQMALSMGLPFLGGAIPSALPESYQKGGTGMGMAVGGLGSGLTGAGFGAAVGSFVPGIGTGLGAGVGAAIGAISGALSKLTVSFEEAAREISDVSAAIKIQMDAVSSVSRITKEMIQLDAEGGRGTREMKALEKSKLEAVALIEDPKIRRLMTGTLKEREKGEEMQREEAARKSIGGNLYSAFTGAMEMGKGATESRAATSRISSSLVPFFKDMTQEQLSDYSQAIQRDPIGTIRTIMAENGISEEQINRAMPGSTVGALNPNQATAKYLTYGAGLDAISKARSIKRDEGLGSAKRKTEVERMRGLMGLSSKFRQEGEFEKISFGADQSIFGVQKELALSNPRLSELDKIGLQSYYGQSAARREYESESRSQMGTSKSALLDALGKSGADSDSARGRISGLSSLQDLKALLRDTQPDNILKSGLSGIATPEFRKALEDSVRSQETLAKSLEEQNRATIENTTALEDDYRLKNSRVGGTDYYMGQLEKAETALNNAIERNDTPDIIQALKTALDLAKVGARYQAGGSTLGFDIGNLRTRLGESRETSMRNIEAVRGLASSPNGSELVSGSMLQQAEMEAAKMAGAQGKSMESFYGGFKSGFARMKKDMNDLSDLGANLGQSLESNLSGAFGDFVTGAKSGKDAFRSFATSVLNDASRMFASQAIQGILGSIFGGISSPAGVSIGQTKTMPLAAGGKVPAMLTGGEYYIGPNSAKKIGYDTLHRLNGYADGGIVKGGSGVKDDVPARLAPGSFIIKKAAVNKLGPDYLDSLVNGKVQHRFLGGALLGALLGGGIGYATGGKKGAIAGALIGGIGGGLAQNVSQTGKLFQSDPNAGMFQFSSSVGNVPAGYEVGVGAPAAAAKPPMPMWQKAAWGLGAAALLGGVSKMLTPKDPKFTPWTSTQITENRKKMEAEQSGMSAPAGLYPWLSPNPNGGSNMMGYVLPPTRRMYAGGGAVGMSSPLFMSEGGAVGVTGSVDSGVMTPAASSRGGGAASNVNVTIEINNNGSTSSSATSDNQGGQGGFGSDFAQKIQKQIQGIVQQELVNQSRSDGFFAQRGRFIQR